ncbi:MAG: hypothetical protein RIB98_09650 [Acidimicrobiales bacterium]
MRGADTIATPMWWFDDLCQATDECVPPLPADVPAATFDLDDGHTDFLEVDQEGAVLIGRDGVSIGLLEVAAADVSIIGLDVDTTVVHPTGNGTYFEANRMGQLFVNGADDVIVRGNLIRPYEDGPDAIQIKTFDEDQPVRLLVEANVIGPQPTDGEAHTDCVQILGGDDLRFSRNVILPCGDKAFQIRSGAGGTVGSVLIESTVMFECPGDMDGCDGIHAIVWASTPEIHLELRHNTIRGSVGLSSSGSTIDPGANFEAVGNIASSLPCTDGVRDNLTVTEAACEGRGISAEFPRFLDDSWMVGDLRPVDGEDLPVSAEPFGPALDGADSCAAPGYGAFTGCP